MEEKKHCKWYNDEFCTNDKSPCVADFCPVVEYPELCKCMEEDLANKKELTDEEIVKAFEHCKVKNGRCTDCSLKEDKLCVSNEDILYLIHRLQGENERLSLIAGMIDKGVAVEIVNMQETIDTQKAEIELLTEELQEADESIKYSDELLGKRREEISKLQKQVDELKEERENMQAEIMRFEDMKFTQEHCDLYKENEWLKASLQQAVKDTAKEIYSEIGDDDILVISTQEYGKIEVVPLERLQEIVKGKGVEVE